MFRAAEFDDYPEYQLQPGVGHPKANRILKAPEGMEDECGDLECEVLDTDNVGTVTMSRWLLTDEHRQMLVNGAHVRLEICQHPMPPVALSIEGPPCPECGREMRWDERMDAFYCAHSEVEAEVPGLGDI